MVCCCATMLGRFPPVTSDPASRKMSSYSAAHSTESGDNCIVRKRKNPVTTSYVLRLGPSAKTKQEIAFLLLSASRTEDMFVRIQCQQNLVMEVVTRLLDGGPGLAGCCEKWDERRVPTACG